MQLLIFVFTKWIYNDLVCFYKKVAMYWPLNFCMATWSLQLLKLSQHYLTSYTFSVESENFSAIDWNFIFLPAITHTLAPPVPTIVSVEAKSSTSISVQWAANKKDGSSPVIGYVVEYRPTLNPASPFKTWVVAGYYFSTTLVDLTPSTEYEVRVREENALDRSNPSTSILTKTSELSKRCEFQTYQS